MCVDRGKWMEFYEMEAITDRVYNLIFFSRIHEEVR